MNTKEKGKGEDKGKSKKAIIGIALAAIIAISIFVAMPVLGDIHKLGTDGDFGSGVNATINTTLGGNTTVAGELCRYLNFTLNVTPSDATGTGTGINVSNLTITFPAGFTINPVNYNTTENISKGGFRATTDYGITNITADIANQNLTFYNISGWNITSNETAMFYFNMTVGRVGDTTTVLQMNETNATQTITATAWVWDNRTGITAALGTNTTDIHLDVYNLTQDDTAAAQLTAPEPHALTSPVEWHTTPGTIMEYNLTLTNTNCSLNEVYNRTKITLTNLEFMGDALSITTNATGFDIGNISTSANEIAIWNLTINPDDSIYVNIPLVNATTTANATGTFKVEFYNYTLQGGYNNIQSPPTVVTDSPTPAAENLTVHIIPKLVVGNPAMIYVQAQNSTGVLANTTNVSVRLKTNNTNALINGTETKEVTLVYGYNYTAAINTTVAGIYRVTAADLNVTATPLWSGNDTIEYIATSPKDLKFNLTSVTAAVSTNVSLKISAQDLWGNINTSDTRMISISVGEAKITSINGVAIPPVSVKLENLVNGQLDITVYHGTVEPITVTATDIYGLPSPVLTTASSVIEYIRGDVSKIVVSPSAVTKYVGTDVEIMAQLADAANNPVAQPNVTINFTLNNNVTTLAGFVNGTLNRYTALTNDTGAATTVCTLPTQESTLKDLYALVPNVTAVVQGNPGWNGTSGNITTVNLTINKINVTWNTTLGHTDGIVKAANEVFLDLNITLQDVHGNRAEESRLVNYTSDFGILSKVNGTTTVNGTDTLRIRSLDPGTASITAESLPLTSGTFTAKFYGDATKIVATPKTVSSAIVDTPINVTIEAQDTYGTKVEDFSNTQNVTINVSMTTTVNVTSSAAVYNVTARNMWEGGTNAATINMTGGNATIAINDTAAETVWVNLTSGTLTPVNTTVTFTPRLPPGTYLNATNVTADTVNLGQNITVQITLRDQYGNLMDYDLAPVVVELNQTWAKIIATTLGSPVTGLDTKKVTGVLTDGKANVTITSVTQAGYVNVTPSCPAYPGLNETNETIRFLAGPYKTVKVTTDRDAIVANGTDAATITATLYDEYGNVNTTATDVIIDLTTTKGTLTPITTNKTVTGGYVNATLNSTEKGTAYVNATTTDTAITSIVNTTVKFVGEPFKFTMSVSPTSLAASTAASPVNATITVQVVDSDGESVAMNRSFNLSLVGATPSSFVTNTYPTNGTWTGQFYSLATGNVTVWMNSTDGLVAADNVTVTFTKEYPSLPLRIGWNLVSVPKTLASGSDDPTTVFSLDTGEVLWYYDAATTSWKGKTDLTKIEPCKGYWVYKDAAETVSLTYKTMTGAIIPPSVDLVANWNMIGHTSVETLSIEQSLTSLIYGYAKYSNVLMYNATGWHWASCGPTDGAMDNGDFANMAAGQGYWIFMKEAATYAAVSV